MKCPDCKKEMQQTASIFGEKRYFCVNCSSTFCQTDDPIVAVMIMETGGISIPLLKE
jgi:hypothetical protein